MIETVESPLEPPEPQASTPALIEHIVARYHATHRSELPDLIVLAQKVETVHADDVHAPHGLTAALKAVFMELEDHMQNEESVVFPALKAGMRGRVDNLTASLRDDHAGQMAALNRIAAITHGLRLPPHACSSWTRLYAGLGKLAEDLDEHIYLENDVLFPRFEIGA